jgi:hypothetical protein
MIVPILTLIAGAIVGYIFAENASPRPVFIGLIPFSLVTIIVFGAAAYFLDMKRLYVYGAIVGLVSPWVNIWRRLSFLEIHCQQRYCLPRLFS